MARADVMECGGKPNAWKDESELAGRDAALDSLWIVSGWSKIQSGVAARSRGLCLRTPESYGLAVSGLGAPSGGRDACPSTAKRKLCLAFS